MPDRPGTGQGRLDAAQCDRERVVRLADRNLVGAHAEDGGTPGFADRRDAADVTAPGVVIESRDTVALSADLS